MSTTHAVDLGGVTVRGAWASPTAEVQAELAVYTKTGQARIAVLDERDLIRLIAEAAAALDKLRAHAQAVRTGETVAERSDTRALLDACRTDAMCEAKVHLLACPKAGR